MGLKVAPFKFETFSPKQNKVMTWWTVASPVNEYDMLICDGSVRSGKTIPTITSFVLWAQSTHQDQNFILGARSMGTLKRNVLKPMFKILAALSIPYRYVRGEDPHVIIGTNTYYLFGGSTEASQDAIQGLTAAGALLDEIALMPESFVEQAIARCSVDGAKVFATCNPDGGPTHWFKRDYIDKAKAKRIVYLHFTMDDNLTLSPRVKERYRRMFTGLWFKRYILGLWTIAEGAIYDMWDDEKHVVNDTQLPKDNIGRVAFHRYWVWVDYGDQNPTRFLLIAHGIDDRFYVLAEYHHSGREAGKGRTLALYAADLTKFMDEYLPQGVMPQTIGVDPSAAAFITQLHSERTRDPRFSRVGQVDNTVLDGIRATGSLLGQGRIKVHKRCKHLIGEFSAYVWDPKAAEKGEDAPIKANDHSLDCLRYGINGTRNLWTRWTQRSA